MDASKVLLFGAIPTVAGEKFYFSPAPFGPRYPLQMCSTEIFGMRAFRSYRLAGSNIKRKQELRSREHSHFL